MSTLLIRILLNFQSDVVKKYSLHDKLNDFSFVLSKVCFITLVVNFKNTLAKKMQIATGATCYLADLFKQRKDVIFLYLNQCEYSCTYR